MKNIIHGANPENLYRAFNIPMPGKIFDFSSNTNIFPWPEKILELDLKTLTSHYPDPECQSLREKISAQEKISSSRILFTNGVNEAIFLLARLLDDQKNSTGILQPCYSEYARAFPQAKGVFNIEEAGRFKNFILTNPNNPTGIFIRLAKIIKNFPDTLFIIDEAYIDFLTGNEQPERLCDFENVILLRSLTKIFHLSGVRIGYTIANEKIISALKTFQPSWSVNALAQELALRFLNEKNFYEATKNFYRENTPCFIKNFRQAGFEVMGSAVHYFLVRVEDDFALIKKLLPLGLVVRHTRNFPGLEGKFIRVATQRPFENEMLVKAMSEKICHA